MEVHFVRTGEKRYGVTVIRKDQPAVERNSCPGYDPLIPHDLMHLVVEIELGLTRGIYGQLENGGNAGSFVPAEDSALENTRVRKRTKKRGDKLLRQGHDQCLLSEHASYICMYEWFARSKDPKLRKRASEMASYVKTFRGNLPRGEANALNEDVITRVCARLDDFSARWSAVRIGESVTVEWPENLRRMPDKSKN
jgi:hypothetical protein